MFYFTIYYRKKILKSAWNDSALSYRNYAIFAVSLPQILGGFIGAVGISKLPDIHDSYFELYSIWLLSSIPIGLALGGIIFNAVSVHIIKHGWGVRGWV